MCFYSSSGYYIDLWPCPPAEKGPRHLVEIKSTGKAACLDNSISFLIDYSSSAEWGREVNLCDEVLSISGS